MSSYYCKIIIDEPGNLLSEHKFKVIKNEKGIVLFDTKEVQGVIQCSLSTQDTFINLKKLKNKIIKLEKKYPSSHRLSYMKNFLNQFTFEKEKEECPICCNLVSGKVFTCINRHIICVGCRQRLGSCPLCRLDLSSCSIKSELKPVKAEGLKKGLATIADVLFK